MADGGGRMRTRTAMLEISWLPRSLEGADASFWPANVCLFIFPGLRASFCLWVRGLTLFRDPGVLAKPFGGWPFRSIACLHWPKKEAFWFVVRLGRSKEAIALMFRGAHSSKSAYRGHHRISYDQWVLHHTVGHIVTRRVLRQHSLSSMFATRNNCIATSNKCLTSSNEKLLVGSCKVLNLELNEFLNLTTWYLEGCFASSDGLPKSGTAAQGRWSFWALAGEPCPSRGSLILRPSMPGVQELGLSRVENESVLLLLVASLLRVAMPGTPSSFLFLDKFKSCAFL